MPPAYLRAPEAVKPAAEALDPGCCSKERKTKKQAMAAERRRGSPAFQCQRCGQWHNQPREPR